MKKLLLALIVLLPLTITAAPTNSTVTTLIWDANPISENVEGYTVYCGTTSGVYTLVTSSGGATQLPISSAVTVDGNYYCAVTARNSLGEGPYSSEVNFIIAGGIASLTGLPSAPSSLRLQ